MQWSPHALGDIPMIRHGLLHTLHDSWYPIRPCCCTRSVPAVPADATGSRCSHMLTAAARTIDWQPKLLHHTRWTAWGADTDPGCLWKQVPACGCCLHLQLPVAGCGSGCDCWCRMQRQRPAPWTALSIGSTSIRPGLTVRCQTPTIHHTTPCGRCMTVTMLNCPALLGAASRTYNM